MQPTRLQSVSIDSEAFVLAELADELPLAASQFGQLLTTVLEHRENPGQAQPKDPRRTSAAEPHPEDPHYCWNPMPPSGVDEGISSVIYVTISGHATGFYARGESLVMDAAVAAVNGPVVGTDNPVASSRNQATAEGFSKAMEKNPFDPMIQKHFQNVKSAVSEILNRQSARQPHQGMCNTRATAANTQQHLCPHIDCTVHQPFIVDEKKGDPVSYKFFSINDVWKPALASAAKLTDGLKCVKFVIGEKELLSLEPEIQARCLQLETEEDLTLGPMLEKDIKRMLELNGISFPYAYGRHIIKRSQCFRDRAGEMVAWAGTHEDFSIAALHVLPEYRKMGLGRLVLQNLALMHVRVAREVLTAGGNLEANEHLEMFAHADCVMHNVPTMVFMERCGWHRAGHYLWLGLMPDPESNAK